MPVLAGSPSNTISPTTRSRTLLFISYRDSTARSSRPTRPFNALNYASDDNYTQADEHQRLIGTPDHDLGHVSFDMSSPPKWVEISDQVEDILVGTQAKIAALEKLHAKHVLPGFSDRSAEEREIEAASTDITRDFRKCQALIQDISSHTFPPGATSSSNREATTVKNVQRGLAAKVQEMSATFRKKQRVYMEKLQGHAIKNQDLLIASGAISLKGSEGMSAVDEDVEAVLHKGPMSAQEVLEPDLQARDREITEIAKSITQLAELFKDLSNLVIDQGTLLDSVEYNIEQTSVHVAEAVTELKIASQYQRNTGRRQCIFLLLLIIFGLILVLIFKPRSHSSPDPNPIAVPPASDNSNTPFSDGISTLASIRSVLHRWAFRRANIYMRTIG